MHVVDLAVLPVGHEPEDDPPAAVGKVELHPEVPVLVTEEVGGVVAQVGRDHLAGERLRPRQGDVVQMDLMHHRGEVLVKVVRGAQQGVGELGELAGRAGQPVPGEVALRAAAHEAEAPQGPDRGPGKGPFRLRPLARAHLARDPVVVDHELDVLLGPSEHPNNDVTPLLGVSEEGGEKALVQSGAVAGVHGGSTSSGRWSLQAQCRPAARHEPVAPPAFLQGSAGTLAPKASALTFYGRLIVGQQLVHDQGCLTVHPGQDVAVGVEGDRHGGMSQHLGDLLGVDVPPEEEGGSRVTKIVEPDHR